MNDIWTNEIVSTNIGSAPKARTYNELFQTVTEVSERLLKLESVADQSNRQQSSEHAVNLVSAPPVDYHILPDVGTSIWLFTRHESSGQAEDWICSVDGMAQVNQWPLRHRLTYVRLHVTQAAQNWFLLEDFHDWDTCVRSFKAKFVRTLRKLEARVQELNEPTIDYFYPKLGLCRSLDQSFANTREYVFEGLRSQSMTDWVYG